MCPEINPSPVFRRPHLAAELANRLPRPGVLDEGFRSGLVLLGPRHTGRTTFPRTDLVAELVRSAVRQTWRQLETPTSPLLSRLRQMRGLDLGAMGFRFGFQLERLGERGGGTLAQAFTELVDQSGGGLWQGDRSRGAGGWSQPVVNERLAPMC